MELRAIVSLDQIMIMTRLSKQNEQNITMIRTLRIMGGAEHFTPFLPNHEYANRWKKRNDHNLDSGHPNIDTNPASISGSIRESSNPTFPPVHGAIADSGARNNGSSSNSFSSSSSTPPQSSTLTQSSTSSSPFPVMHFPPTRNSSPSRSGMFGNNPPAVVPLPTSTTSPALPTLPATPAVRDSTMKR